MTRSLDHRKNPSIVERSRIKSSKEHQTLRERVVTHACGVSGRGLVNRIQLRPGCPVPSPSLVLNGSTEAAAEHNDQAQGCIIRHGGVCSWRRTRCRKLLHPGGSIPGPGVVVLDTKVLDVTAEKDDCLRSAIVGDRGAAWGRPSCRKLLRPGGSIPGPRVPEDLVITIDTAESSDGFGGCIIRHARLIESACRWRYCWKLLRPSGSIPGPGVV